MQSEHRKAEVSPSAAQTKAGELWVQTRAGPHKLPGGLAFLLRGNHPRVMTQEGTHSSWLHMGRETEEDRLEARGHAQETLLPSLKVPAGACPLCQPQVSSSRESCRTTAAAPIRGQPCLGYRPEPMVERQGQDSRAG